MPETRHKTGIFGGTFNPVHFGHLRAAEEARETLGLDRILFIPCYQPPHKLDTDVVDPKCRLEMLRLAIADNPHFEASEIELERGGRSYSIETLGHLKERYGESEEIYFIIGMDSFADIGIWKDYQQLFAITDFVVVTRPGYMTGKDPMEMLPVDIKAEFCYDSTSKKMEHKSGRSTLFLETTLMDISATRIRDDIRRGRSVRYLLPSAVERLIRDRGLYGGKGQGR